MFGFLILILGAIFIMFFFNVGFENLIEILPLILLFGILFLFVLFSITSQTIISNDEISTKNLLGSKTLPWTQISRVSGKGHAIKLHNFDNDVTIAPNPQLPGYNEVVEWIGIKRPDLFNPLEYSEMTRSWVNGIFLLFVGLLVIGIGAFLMFQSNTTDGYFPFLIFFIIFIVILAVSLSSPQSVTIEGKSLVIKYLFNQKTLLADEIASIDLRYTQTRNGKNYFVALTLTNKKVIRISGVKPSLPIVQLVLKNWHKTNASTGLTNQQN